ncbi:proline-rich transmembrane protein 3-like [Montipora foliosa]|uniref:proline-rich transmembrane protein 3-like n=1 Tax=Montipora foliosa TaxID=591990 RepID=UPI0035F18D2B
MRNVRSWSYKSFAAKLILCFSCFCGSWEHKVGSDDVSYQAERRANEINNVIESEVKRDLNNQELQLFSSGSENHTGSRQKTLKTDRPPNTKYAEKRLKVNREEMNSSLDRKCVQTEESGVVNQNRQLQKEIMSEIHSHGHVQGPEMYRKRKIRQKRDTHSTESTFITPEPSPEGSPESSYSEPSITSQPKAYPEQTWPEPEPEWSLAFNEWDNAWPLHTYGFAVIFTLIALVPPLELLGMYLDKTKLSALKATLLSTIFIFSSIRAFSLFVDPYGSRKRLPLAVNRLLFSLGHPCIISALSLLLLVLIDTTKMNIAPPRFQKVKFIIPVVIFHVILVLVTDFVVVHFLEAKDLLLLCQIYFLLLGSLLSVGYICVGWKIRKNIIRSQNLNDKSLRRLQYLIMACAVTCVCLCVITVYAAAGVFGVYSDVKYVDAWPWWIFQTLGRLLEVAICIVMLLMNSRSSKRKIKPSFSATSVFYLRRSTMKVKQSKQLEGLTITATE